LNINEINDKTFNALTVFSDVQSISISVSNKLNNLTLFSKFENLTYLYFTSNTSNIDIGSFSALKNLETLHLNDYNGNIKDFSSLSKLTNLITLSIESANPALYVPYIANLPKLENVTISTSTTTNEFSLAPLAGFNSVKTLSLRGGNFTNYESLSEMRNLTSLDLGYSSNIKSLEPFKGITNLTSFSLSGSYNIDITPLANLVNLTVLKLWNNNITDITPLAGLINLEELDLGSNNINDFSPISRLENLTSLNVWGNASDNYSAIQHILDEIEERWQQQLAQWAEMYGEDSPAGYWSY